MTPPAPGSGTAALDGCRCDPVRNRNGRGLGGIVAVVDGDGVARKASGLVYEVSERCPLHAPPSRWAMPLVLLAGAAASMVTSLALSPFVPVLISVCASLAVAVLVMLGGAYSYDRRRRR
jgi:hypothetical protein